MTRWLVALILVEVATPAGTAQTSPEDIQYFWIEELDRGFAWQRCNNLFDIMAGVLRTHFGEGRCMKTSVASEVGQEMLRYSREDLTVTIKLTLTRIDELSDKISVVATIEDLLNKLSAPVGA